MNEPLGLRDWMRKVDNELERLDDKWQKSVDDIKRTIIAEVAEIKQEPIADLRRRLEDGYRTLGEMEKRLRDTENTIRDWTAGRTVISWLIKTLIGIGGLAVGYLGAKHL